MLFLDSADHGINLYEALSAFTLIILQCWRGQRRNSVTPAQFPLLPETGLADTSSALARLDPE